MTRLVWSSSGIGGCPRSAADDHVGRIARRRGVRMAIEAAPTKPPTAVPVARLGELSGLWVYLIDPAANTLTVLSADDPASPTARYTFTAPPAGAADPE